MLSCLHGEYLGQTLQCTSRKAPLCGTVIAFVASLEKERQNVALPLQDGNPAKGHDRLGNAQHDFPHCRIRSRFRKKILPERGPRIKRDLTHCLTCAGHTYIISCIVVHCNTLPYRHRRDDHQYLKLGTVSINLVDLPVLKSRKGRMRI